MTPSLTSRDRSANSISEVQACLPAPEAQLQAKLLEAVSRTFALTIPRLPRALRDVVANAYLLCRIIDTIEDEVLADHSHRTDFFVRFQAVLLNRELATNLAKDLTRALSPTAPAGERELIARLPEVVAINRRFSQTQQQIVCRCVRIMAKGMKEFDGLTNAARTAGDAPAHPPGATGSMCATARSGLADMHALDNYCYHVAGVVGETLTELFCDYSPAIAERREELMPLSVSFGSGLQLTNILKDVHVDHQRGYCWLPRSLFGGDKADFDRLLSTGSDGALLGSQCLDAGIQQLILHARAHLDDAVRYTTLIPARENGLRAFCLWSISMALLTLRQVYRRKAAHGVRPAKISRTGVRAALALSLLGARHNRLLAVFGTAGLGLPPTNNRQSGQKEFP